MTNNHSFHTCQAIVVHCMDFRLRKYLNEWTKHLAKGGFDLVSIAGSVKDLDYISKQIEISNRLHHIKEVYLINHEDCGAYGKEGTFEKHKEDLNSAKKVLEKKFPHLQIFLYYLKLSGEFIKL